MNCPVCTNVKLALSERQGIEIDYCPTCRGVWLDRGELDKLIERAQPSDQVPASAYDEDDDGDGRSRGGRRGERGRRESWLSELFEFGS